MVAVTTPEATTCRAGVAAESSLLQMSPWVLVWSVGKEGEQGLSLVKYQPSDLSDGCCGLMASTVMRHPSC